MYTFKGAIGLSVLSVGLMGGTAKVTAQEDFTRPAGNPATPVRTTNDRMDFDLGWLGLIGLAGLAGLMGRSDRTTRHDVVLPTGTTGHPGVAR